MQQTTEAALETQLIDLYGQLLLDTNLVFAIILSWAITHVVKQWPLIKNIRPVAQRKFIIRLLTIAIGFGAVVFFKRHLIDTHLDHVINFGIMVAFTHPVLYKIMTVVLSKIFPSAAEVLKSK